MKIHKPFAILSAVLSLGAALVSSAALAADKAPPGSVLPNPSELPLGVVKKLGDTTRRWDVVRALAFSPDGTSLIAASDDGLLTVLDPKTGRPLRSFGSRRRAGRVQGAVLNSPAFFQLAFSPDGKTLAAASGDRTVKLWEGGPDWKDRDPLTGHTDGVFGVSFLPGGKTLVTASDDHTARVWSLKTNKQTLLIPRPGGYLSSMAVSPDGKTLAVGAWDHTIRLYATSDGKEKLVVTLSSSGRALSLSFAPDGATLASGWVDGKIVLWDAAEGSERRTLNGHTGAVLSLSFAPDGATLASGAADGTARLWDLTSLSDQPRTIPAHKGDVLAVAFRPDGHTLATGGTDAMVRLWDVATGKESGAPSDSAGATTSLAYGDGLIVAGDDTGTIKVWDVDKARVRLTVSGAHEGPIQALALSPDGKTLASAGADKSIRIWDLASAKEKLAIPAHTGAVTSVVYSPDGRVLVSAGTDRLIRYWDPVDGRRLQEIEPDEDDDPEIIAISRDGLTLTSAGHRNLTVKIHDFVTGQLRRSLGGHYAKTGSMAFAPDGKTLVTSAGDGTTRIWEYAAGKTIRAFRLHQPRGSVLQVAYSPKGDRLAAVIGDGTVFLIDPTIETPPPDDPFRERPEREDKKAEKEKKDAPKHKPEARTPAKAEVPAADPTKPFLPIISLDALERKLSEPTLRLLDARPKADYDKGHLPGAVWIDLKPLQKLTRSESFADEGAWSSWLATLGLKPESEVYIYDAERHHAAARVWWLLSYAGVERVGLIDGGYPLWEKEKRPVTAKVVAVEPVEHRARFQSAKNATREEVVSAIKGHSAQLLDTRSPAEYRGEVKAIVEGRRVGHIPTARILEAYDFVDEEGRFLDEATQRARLAKASITGDQPVILYSAGGGRSSVASFVFDRLGIPNRHYYLGWADWSAAASVPVVKGQNPGEFAE